MVCLSAWRFWICCSKHTNILVVPSLLESLRRIASSPAFSVGLIVPLAALYFACFHPYTSFTDTAFFGGDTWEYQSMGVNLAYGHGVSMWGGIESFETYAFADEEWNRQYGQYNATAYRNMRVEFARTGERGGDMDTNRMPLYPLFIGAVYKIFGVHPLILKNIQLLLLALMAAGLPLLGFLWWKEKGMIAGLLAGVPVVALTIRFTDVILVEMLAAFMLFLFVLGTAFYERRPGPQRAILVGLLCGLCLLTKLSTMFVLPLFPILLWWTREAPKMFLRDALLMIGSCIVIMLPWSVYASLQTHTFVLFSTESHDHGLLDAHNEYTESNGHWHPEWRTKLESFYHNDGLQSAPDILRIAHFYVTHPIQIIRLPLIKIDSAFFSIPSIMLLGIFLLMEGLFGARKLSSRIVRVALLMIGLGLWWKLFHRNDLWFDLREVIRSAWMWAVLGFLLIAASILLRRFRMQDQWKIPVVAVAVFLNFLLMMILVMSDDFIYPSRHVKVAEFLWVLLTARVGVEWIQRSLLPLQHDQ